MPTVTVEAGFGFGVNDTVTTWVDLTDRVGYPGGIRWAYGRSNEREQPDAGIGSITFDNSDRALDPTNTASPYYPDVKQMVQIRVTATHNASTRDVLYAYAEGWPPEWEGAQYGWVRVPIVDGFKLLSMAQTSAAYTEEKTGTRIGDLLDAAGWPAGRRDIDVGQSYIQAYEASQRIVLNALRETAEVEVGLFFINPSGDATFHSRLRRINPTSAYTFDESTGLPYETVLPSYDESDIWNEVAITPWELEVRTAGPDATSKGEYGHRRLDKLDLRVISTDVAQDMADGLLARHKDPVLRVERLTVEGDLFSGDGTDPDVMEAILELGVGDLVTVVSQPAGGGSPLSVDVFIEHVSHRIEATSWRTTYQLSPFYDDQSGVWLIGVVGASEIGTTTVLGW
jgi:hypothetical protein